MEINVYSCKQPKPLRSYSYTPLVSSLVLMAASELLCILVMVSLDSSTYDHTLASMTIASIALTWYGFTELLYNA